jgi:hypothetical protein
MVLSAECFTWHFLVGMALAGLTNSWAVREHGVQGSRKPTTSNARRRSDRVLLVGEVQAIILELH